MGDSNVGLIRRLLPVWLTVAGVVVLAALWSIGWHIASSLASSGIESWRQHEAAAGRDYSCGQESFGGYPFRIELRCSDPVAEFRSSRPPVALKARDLMVVAQVYQPSLLISEFTGPLTISEPGRPPEFIADWTLGHSSVRGTPAAPERVSTEFENIAVDRAGSGANVFKARHFELHGRIADGSVASNPTLDFVLVMAGASAPEIHPLTVQPLDADVNVVVRGLADFAPKPWPTRFREMQARRGGIEFTKARVQQGDVIAVGTGTLGLTERGGLNGQLQVTIVGLEKVLKTLNVDRMVSEGEIGSALNALDRLVPGLGQIARQNAGPGIVAGLGAIGQATTLEGKPAVAVPLRFNDGAIFLGPLLVGRTQPLF